MKNKEQSPKEKAIYRAVIELFVEGAELNSLTVSEITGKAGIGKGTAYEYFSDKEEMIAKSLYFSMEEFCRRLYEKTKPMTGIYNKMKSLMNEMEKPITEGNCLLRVFHMMSDSSAISRKFQEIAQQNKEEKMLPEDVIRYILLDELQGKKELSEETFHYLVMNILSRIMCYGMMSWDERYQTLGSREGMKQLICQGIYREVEEMTE